MKEILPLLLVAGEQVHLLIHLHDITHEYPASGVLTDCGRTNHGGEPSVVVELQIGRRTRRTPEVDLQHPSLGDSPWLDK